MNKLPRQSIDGIKPSSIKPQQKIYIQKRPLSAQQPEKLISIQPKQRTPYTDIATISDIKWPRHGRRPSVSSTTRPNTNNAMLHRLDDKEVVVKLPRKLSLRTGLLSLIQYILIAVVAMISAYSTSIGQWFVLAFALYALIRRQDSSLTFGVALFILISVPIFQLINQPGVANNMAVYVYELLVVGTIQALIELKWPRKLDIDTDSV